MSSNIPGNVAKLSGECRQILWGMTPNIPENVVKHSGECPQTFRRMSPNIPGYLLKYSGECPQTFRGMLLNIPGNVTKHSAECRQAFRGMFCITQGNEDAESVETPENQTNYKQLQNTKTIERKERQNKNTPECFCNKEKESQKDKQEEVISKKANKNMAIVRSLNDSGNPQKTITADDHKNGKPKGEKNKKSIFVMGDSMGNVQKIERKL